MVATGLRMDQLLGLKAQWNGNRVKGFCDFNKMTQMQKRGQEPR
jgi:hypothetical protein